MDRIPRKVMEWAMRKRGLPEMIVRAVMSLYEGARTRIRVGSQLSEEFGVKVGVYQGSVLSPLVFAIVVDVVTESVRAGLMSEILYADDLVLMSETMEGLREKFQKWKEAFESKGDKSKSQKDKSDGEWVRRRKNCKQDRPMWHVWEEGNGKLSTV